MKLMEGKKGIVMGVANDHSLAWGIAKELASQGAEMVFSYQSEVLYKRVKPLADSLGGVEMIECDVTDDSSLVSLFERVGQKFGKIDFIVHAIAFSDRNHKFYRTVHRNQQGREHQNEHQ